MMTECLHYISVCRTSTRACINDHWSDVVTLSGTLTTAYVVNKVWGKYTTFCFGIAGAVAYPYLRRQMDIFLHFDTSSFTQICIAVSIVGLSFISPIPTAGMATLLALAILKREQEHALNIKNNQLAIEKLRKDNDSLSRFYSDTETDFDRLDTELNVCLSIPGKLQQIIHIQATSSAVIEEANQKANDRMVQLRAKMQKLSSLCQHVISQEHLLKRVNLASQVENDLTRMTLECSTRQQELANLHREIGDLKVELRTVLSSLSDQDMQLRSKLLNLKMLLGI